MKKILLGGYVQEGHSFVGGQTGLSDFQESGYLVEGDELLGLQFVRGGELNGVVEAIGSSCGIVPSVHGWANSGPPLSRTAYDFFESSILKTIESCGHVDAVILVLHGASLVEGLDDPEGRLILRVRQAVGDHVPIAVTFDLHANVTSTRAKHADVIVGYATCPHVDLYETGRRAAEIVLRTLRGEVSPTTTMRKIPMITASPAHDTNHGAIVPILAIARGVEALPSVLSASWFFAQPWVDVPTLGNSICLVTDGQRGLGQGLADEIGTLVWSRREAFDWHGTPVEEAIVEAAGSPPGMVALGDGADSPTAGANGDGNEVLRALVHSRFSDSALLTIVDAAAVSLAHAAGPGATIDVPLGGTVTPDFYTPIRVSARVLSLHDGSYWLEAQPRTADVGKIAVLGIGKIVVVVTERKPFMLDASLFHHVGLDPRAFRIVVVKSAGGFRAVFEPLTSRVIDLETVGPSTSEFSRLPYRCVPRPLWPLDRDLDARARTAD